MGGDFNAHFAQTDSDLHVGKFGLESPTTLGGRILREFLVRTDLKHVDSHFLCSCRGTWRHAQTGRWCELDAFLASPALFDTVQRGLFTFSFGFSDHLGKAKVFA